MAIKQAALSWKWVAIGLGLICAACGSDDGNERAVVARRSALSVGTQHAALSADERKQDRLRTLTAGRLDGTDRG